MMRMTEKIVPKIFISYSWAIDKKVKELAERLVINGVDVVLDKWDLKEGQDKYVFMEQAVNNSDVSRVLIICDKTYTDKANDRTGGVGDETVIISSEVYGKVGQEKFVPVVMELDEDGKAYLPSYIKSRIYIDLSNDDTYEENYDKLLRNVYGKPEHIKPKRGTRPAWLEDEEVVNLSGVRDIIKQLKSQNTAKRDYLVLRAKDDFSQALKACGQDITKHISGEMLLNQFSLSKTVRDVYIEYLDVLISNNMDIGNIVPSFLETVHKFVMDRGDARSCNLGNFEIFKIALWEWFICATAVFLHYEKYTELHRVLTHTYFLTDVNGSSEQPLSYSRAFYHYSSFMEDDIKRNSQTPNLYTFAGNLMIEREWKPMITKASLSNADLILYQMATALSIDQYWFPMLYCYWNKYLPQPIWSRMISKAHCERIMPLFGVTTIDTLKEQVSKCVMDHKIRYNGSFDAAQQILNSINLEKIGTMN